VLLVLSRQAVPTLDRTLYASAQGVRRGGYVLKDAVNGKPQLILIASGSEVGLIVAAADHLHQEGIAVRCVSMPSWDLFNALPKADRDAVLPPSVRARLAVEAGATQGWHRYVGDAGDVIGVDRFGASAPGKTVLHEYGFTVDNVCMRAKALLS
jgi:transketolase